MRLPNILTKKIMSNKTIDKELLEIKERTDALIKSTHVRLIEISLECYCPEHKEEIMTLVKKLAKD